MDFIKHGDLVQENLSSINILNLSSISINNIIFYYTLFIQLASIIKEHSP